MAKYLMGIDNGSTTIKAGVFDEKGNELGTAGVRCGTASPKPGWYERSTDDIWEANKKAIAEAIKNAGINAEEIVCISLTGHGNGAHLVDSNGNGVRNTIEGADLRAGEYAQRWQKDGTLQKVHPKNMQALWPALTLCVLAWLKDNEPETLEKTKWWLNVKDFVRMKLTGEAFLEYSDASGGGVINTRDRKIDGSIFADSGIEGLERLLPPLRYATEECGRITKQAAAETGLSEGTPVAAGCYDIDTAALASGVADDNYINVIIGSWANNQFVSKTPLVSEEFFSTTLFAIEGYYLMLEGSATGAINFEWFLENIMAADVELAKAQGRSIYEVCDKAMLDTPVDESEIVFLPFLYGSNTGNPDMRASFIGIEGWHKMRHVIRALYEGVAFTHRWHVERLEKHGKLPDAIRLAGGAARSEQWCALFADVLNRPVETTEATELGTLGAAMCAAVCAGIYKDFKEAIKEMVHVRNRVEPNPKNAELYSKKYSNYLRAIEALNAYWKR